MHPLEFAKKQLKNEEKRLNHYFHLYEMPADENYLIKLKEQVEKVKQKKAKVERIKNAPTPFIIQLIANELKLTKQGKTE